MCVFILHVMIKENVKKTLKRYPLSEKVIKWLI